MSKLSELAATLANLSDKLDKAKIEIVTEITKLKEGMGNADIPPEAQASLERLSALAQALDDIIPDAPA